MKKIFTKEWAKATAVRAIKTVAQTAIATIGVSAVMTDVSWVAVGSASLWQVYCLYSHRWQACLKYQKVRNNHESYCY